MTLVVLGVDALDPDIVDPDEHPNLTLARHRPIDTIPSSTGEPSTHELWPTIITGLPPSEHGLTLDDGVSWESDFLNYASDVAEYVLPKSMRVRLGAWVLNNTAEDTFRTPASYYDEQGLETVFDSVASTTIGVPNYVTDPDEEDREHALRRRMGSLFERDPDAKGGHTSSDPAEFYKRCLEMSMIRIARTRRALRSRKYELVFAYTSGLDLVGHIAHDRPELQASAYAELDEFVGELRDDLGPADDLLLVSDHGLQDGLHTDTAMIAATSSQLVSNVESVTDVQTAIENALETTDYTPSERDFGATTNNEGTSDEVREHLQDLGYM
jgi:predicted AlkP superfamily pyrophosphatase or phosphodiesterase